MLTLNPNQYGLALHTTSPQLGLSLSNFIDDTRSQSWDLDRELSNYIHQYLANFLKPQSWHDIAFIAVAKGPGSFTSTRIGVVTARTLAQQLNLPLYGISTLAAFVWSKREFYPPESLIAVSLPATRGQLYGAIYQVRSHQLTAYLPDKLMTPETWQQTLEHLSYREQVLEVPLNLGITAPSLLELAYQDWQLEKYPQWSEVFPFYGM